MKKEWKLENQLNDTEIADILATDTVTAKALVYEKHQEADIYINYLREQADRLEAQLEILDTGLAHKDNKDFIEKMSNNTKNKTIKQNQARQKRRQGLNPARQNLLKD
jgi:hypothetical protein